VIPKSIHYFEEIYGKKIISAIMESCDGSKTMEVIAEETKIPLETLIFVAEKMVLEGILKVQY